MYLWINCFKFMIHESNMANWLKTVLLIRVISQSKEYFLCFQLLWSSLDLPMRMSIWLWKGHHILLKFFYQAMMFLATSEPFIQRTSATIRARCFFYISMTIIFWNSQISFLLFYFLVCLWAWSWVGERRVFLPV